MTNARAVSMMSVTMQSPGCTQLMDDKQHYIQAGSLWQGWRCVIHTHIFIARTDYNAVTRHNVSRTAAVRPLIIIIIIITSLPKVIWEEGRVAAAVPGAGWHKGLRIRNVCIVLVKDRCANVRYFSVRKQE